MFNLNNIRQHVLLAQTSCSWQDEIGLLQCTCKVGFNTYIHNLQGGHFLRAKHKCQKVACPVCDVMHLLLRLRSCDFTFFHIHQNSVRNLTNTRYFTHIAIQSANNAFVYIILRTGSAFPREWKCKKLIYISINRPQHARTARLFLVRQIEGKILPYIEEQFLFLFYLVLLRLVSIFFVYYSKLAPLKCLQILPAFAATRFIFHFNVALMGL